ncbi:unnamed protein product [Mytilus coruscus]|uniref:Uncharacterized protein n=1 Tax=Mytilus coruscus TaxID=42192 RepID=A0A6J8DCS7_MYTCO|nr:unnamed protein product [Mytilus coruscus]
MYSRKTIQLHGYVEYPLPIAQTKIISGEKYVRILKIMLVDFMKFERNTWVIPNELQMEVENGDGFFSSIVYAYFLQFLCHYHLNNVRQCQDSIHTLQLVIAENYCIEKGKSFQSEAYTILGIALQISGDNGAARQAFMQSVEIYPNHRYNGAARQAFMQSVEIYPNHRYNTSMKRLSLMSSL